MKVKGNNIRLHGAALGHDGLILRPRVVGHFHVRGAVGLPDELDFFRRRLAYIPRY